MRHTFVVRNSSSVNHRVKEGVSRLTKAIGFFRTKIRHFVHELKSDVTTRHFKSNINSRTPKRHLKFFRINKDDWWNGHETFNSDPFYLTLEESRRVVVVPSEDTSLYLILDLSWSPVSLFLLRRVLVVYWVDSSDLVVDSDPNDSEYNPERSSVVRDNHHVYHCRSGCVKNDKKWPENFIRILVISLDKITPVYFYTHLLFYF